MTKKVYVGNVYNVEDGYLATIAESKAEARTYLDQYACSDNFEEGETYKIEERETTIDIQYYEKGVLSLEDGVRLGVLGMEEPDWNCEVCGNEEVWDDVRSEFLVCEPCAVSYDVDGNFDDRMQNTMLKLSVVWPLTIKESEHSGREDLRKRFPNCIQCEEKMIKGHFSLMVQNRDGSLKGPLCSPHCWDQFMLKIEKIYDKSKIFVQQQKKKI